MATPKKDDLKVLQTFIPESVEGIEVLIKAASFDISKGQPESAIQTLDKVRRKLKTVEAKSAYHLNNVKEQQMMKSREIQSVRGRETHLVRDNSRLRQEVATLKKQLNTIFSDEDFSPPLTQSTQSGTTPSATSDEDMFLSQPSQSGPPSKPSTTQNDIRPAEEDMLLSQPSQSGPPSKPSTTQNDICPAAEDMLLSQPSQSGPPSKPSTTQNDIRPAAEDMLLSQPTQSGPPSESSTTLKDFPDDDDDDEMLLSEDLMNK